MLESPVMSGQADLNSAFGRLIKHVRKTTTDWDQAALAKAVVPPVNKETIVRLEQGGNVYLSTVYAVADALQIPLRDLFAERDRALYGEPDTAPSRSAPRASFGGSPYAPPPAPRDLEPDRARALEHISRFVADLLDYIRPADPAPPARDPREFPRRRRLPDVDDRDSLPARRRKG